jgi:hypothetical protein
MSEWNYTKCTKPFDTEESAKNYMLSKDFAGYVLRRESGFSAVCPAYPEGYYPDAKVVLEVENSLGELASEVASKESACC